MTPTPISPPSPEPARPRHPARAAVLAAAGIAAVAGLAACQPTVKLQAPDKPIVINMNVNITQEVRVRLEREADQLLQERKDIF